MIREAVRKSDNSWQVIYMDLMTIIMVFFVILWSINQGKDVGVSETVGDETTNMVNLPGDVLFKPGRATMTSEGTGVSKRLFTSNGKAILNFENNGITKRMLVIHGHTDSDGKKSDNLDLGYRRALSAYKNISKIQKKLPDHVIICTHADNTPEKDVPKFTGKITDAQRQALRAAKAQNRRITIEDKMVDTFGKIK